MWSETGHWVYWFWGLLGVDCGVGQGQLLPFPESPGVSYKMICKWLPLVLGLEVPGRG